MQKLYRFFHQARTETPSGRLDAIYEKMAAAQGVAVNQRLKHLEASE